jgi:hypothetical protein
MCSQSLTHVQQENKTVLKRESMGVVTDSGSPLVDKRTMDAFEKQERFVITNVNKPHEIGLFVDPNVSSTEGSCEQAICSIARINGRLVVRACSLSLSLF